MRYPVEIAVKYPVEIGDEISRAPPLACRKGRLDEAFSDQTAMKAPRSQTENILKSKFQINLTLECSQLIVVGPDVTRDFCFSRCRRRTPHFTT